MTIANTMYNHAERYIGEDSDQNPLYEIVYDPKTATAHDLDRFIRYIKNEERESIKKKLQRFSDFELVSF